MVDTVKIFIPIDPMSSEEYDHCSFPAKGLREFDQDGVLEEPFYRWMTARSPLTGAEFKVKAVSSRNLLPARIVGYIVDINIPACTVGNNLLLVNGAPMACRLAFLLFRHWLLTNGCSRHGIYSMQFDKVRLHSVTPTYLFLCDDLADSHAARREFADHSEAVLNNRDSENDSSRNPAFSIGSSDKATSYIKNRDHLISAYVKDGSVTKAFTSFPSLSVEQAVRTKAKKYLRVEVAFGGAWLRKHRMDRPECWQLSPSKNPYKVGVDLIRKVLKLDVGLRSRAPKEEAIAQLVEPDQSILRWHLAGKKARFHPHILAQGDTHKQNVYFSAVKARLISKCKVDISIPWKVQSQRMSSRLPDLLRLNGQYEPPADIADDIYSPASVPAPINKLTRMIKVMAPRGISSIYVDPHSRDDEVVEVNGEWIVI